MATPVNVSKHSDIPILNGSFEAGTGTINTDFSVEGWALTLPSNLTVISISSSVFYSGNQAIKMAVDAGNSNNGLISNVYSCLPSTGYVLEFYIKSDTAGLMQVQVDDNGGKYVQADGVTWNSTATYQPVTTTPDWTRYTFAFITAAAQTSIRIKDLKRSGLASQASRTFYIDAVKIRCAMPANTSISSRLGSITTAKLAPYTMTMLSRFSALSGFTVVSNQTKH